MTITDPEKVEKTYRRLKRKAEAKLLVLQEERIQQLAPSRLYLPIPWQPMVYEQPVTMFKVVAAQGGQFTSVYDSRVVYQLQEWTLARSGCSNSSASWPPLWSCLYAYPSEHQARAAVFPRSSDQQKGARVLCQVTVQGKGYLHPDGRVATCRLRFDRLLEYVPKGPSERVVSVHYSSSDNHSSGADKARISEQLVGQVDGSRGVSRGGVREGQHSSSVAVPAMCLVEELQEAAWGVEN